jgi:hypothetical protein
MERIMFRAVTVALVLLVTTSVFAEIRSTPELRIAILGNPAHQVPWTDEGLEKLKAIGFNEVQLNIAWSSHPFGESLNLIDIVTVPGEVEQPGTAERRAEIGRRLRLAKKHGLRTLFHFGSPFAEYNPYSGTVYPNHVDDDLTFDSWYDILNPKVRDHELALLREFRRQFPDVDDILVYTYDQYAWETPEFQYNRFSYGVPLSERLPGYLAALHAVWTQGRPGKARMWWEPWELSAGEVYAVLPKLPRADFGLIIHANIGEGILALPADLWLRNTARLCRDLGLPVVAESVFSSATQELQPLLIPAPRLVDEEYAAFLRVPGIVGIKEYFGIDTAAADLDLDLLQRRLHDPSRSSDEIMERITSRFGAAQADVRAYLDLLSDAFQSFPWDASWSAMALGLASVDHGWTGATIQAESWNTPSWQSTRRTTYMKTDDTQPPFWMLEDVELRCRLAAETLDKASDLAVRVLDELSAPSDKVQFQRIQHDVNFFRRVTWSYALHIRETNVAQMLRQDLAANRPMTSALVKELGKLLDSDVANQNAQGRVVEMRRLFLSDPPAFVRRYLIPTAITSHERGRWTLTTR